MLQMLRVKGMLKILATLLLLLLPVEFDRQRRNRRRRRRFGFGFAVGVRHFQAVSRSLVVQKRPLCFETLVAQL